jgi:phenylalanyl-tRNA synthetase beta chain
LKFSLNWLREIIDIDIELDDLADRLTLQGLAVDGVERIRPDIEGVVVSRVVEVVQHPNADKLVVCRVDMGKGAPLKVVCGAPNVKEGGVYPFAPPGARLPGGMKIKEVKLRGEKSSGMLCSGLELEISTDGDTILELDPSLEVGSDLVDQLSLDDHLLDIDVTANRFDLLSHIGVAREIGAIVGSHIRYPDIGLEESGESIELIADVEVIDTEGCPRYMARVIRGVKVAPSPYWLARRLESLGMRSVNNVVDAANYVLFELGHPIHTFDLNLLAGKKIIVRRASSGEKIVTLDEEERTLDPDDVVIADVEKAIAIGGVMGSLDSEISDKTTDVLIECAHFNPRRIRRTSRRLGLPSQASYRFERWVDPNSLPLAIDRITRLLQELAGGVIMRGWIDKYPEPVERVQVRMRPRRAEKILGTKIETQVMADFLESIDLPVEIDADHVEVDVPTFRQDLKAEIDIVEEVARLYGYDRFETPVETGSRVAAGVDPRDWRKEEVKAHLSAHGFREVYTTTFVSEGDSILLDSGIDRSSLWHLRNPITRDARVLRHSLVPGLLDVLNLNINRNNFDLRIFEIGTIFHPAEKGELVPRETTALAGLMVGRKTPVHWKDGSPGRCDFFDMKGVLSALLKEMGCRQPYFPKGSRDMFHPGKCASVVVEGEEVGFMGELHPSLQESRDFQDPPLIFELDGKIIDMFDDRRRFIDISPFPSIRRDISVLVPGVVSFGELEECIQEVCGDLLEDRTLFDIYRGDQVPEDRAALAMTLVFRSNKRTLKDEEIEDVMEKLFEKLEKEFNVTLRPAAD